MLMNNRGAEIKRLKFTAPANTTQLVAGVPGKRIYVLGMFIDTVDNTNTTTFKSNSTEISPDFYMASKGDSVTLQVYENGWFATDTGQSLFITSNQNTIGIIIYTQE